MTTPEPSPAILDRLGRPLRDLRISLIDRCNFRCPYCMPRSRFGPGYRFLPAGAMLGPEEIVRLAAIFVARGVVKLRLTGGEPLLRPEVLDIVRGLSALPLRDLAMTTNGALLARWAAPLRRAGLHRVTVSLDSLDPEGFARSTGSRVPLAQVLQGIEAAQRAGLEPVKLNCVVRRGMNQDAILELVEFARGHNLVLRFIEYMDVGTSNGWRREDVVEGEEILARVARVYPLEEIEAEPGSVGRRYRYADGGELGLVMSVTRPFCRECSRARLSADGKLFTCLFAAQGLDLAGPLRRGASDAEIWCLVARRWQQREDRYSELRGRDTAASTRVEMSYLGG